MPDTEKDLLKEIRENFTFYENEWAPIRKDAKIDMRYVAGDPWDPKEKQERKDADRPCLALDELGQYVNQLINDPRQNKRAIKINPRGAGADDKTAELRGNIIREIEYNSKAQSAYTTGFQGAAERSYGFWRVGKRYVMTTAKEDASPEAFNQELYIGRIPNPDSVMFDPNYTEVDCSDAMGCFVTDVLRRQDFERKWPKAEAVSFNPNQQKLAPSWIWPEQIMVGEYWRVSLESKTLHLVEGGLDGKQEGPVALFEDELPADFDYAKRSMRQRKIDRRVVTQYVTNGIEILDKEQIEIPWIPIVPVFGKEIYVDDGGGAKRRLLSLIRLARDPYMLYCYYRTCEAEVVGMTPKTPWVGAVGQFKTHQSQWQLSNKVPVAFLQYDLVIDPTGNQVIPPPQRQAYEPAIQPLEMGAEAARRAIQSAMGINQLPTAAQRQNQKSGAALKEIESQEDRGSFHFIDNYNFALEHTGRILDAWIPYVYDTEREIGVRQADEKHKSIRINDPNFEEKDDNGQPQKVHYDTTKGEHGVTVSVGPSEESEREQADDFVTQIVSNIEAIAQLLPPQAAAKLLSLSVRLKNLGPIGDEIADTISPPPDQLAQQQAAQQQGLQLKQSQELIAELQAEVQKLQLERAGKIIQGETQKQIATINNDVKVLIAEVTTKMQAMSERQEMFMEYWKETHGAAHEAGMQAADHAHEASQAAASQAAALQQAEVSATPGPDNSGGGTE